MRRPSISNSLLAAAAAAALLAPASASASSGTDCDRIAAPNGSDSAAGTEAAPLRSAQRLVDSLSSGQTGCLRSGSYDQSVTVRQAGITVRPYPGERATLKGRLWIAQGADNVTFEGLKLDGRNSGELPSPTVNANDATFRHNDVTNDYTAICFVVGSSEGWGRARRTVIESNRIHHCGLMPAKNHDHGIYVEAADDTRIVGNWIYDNADRGVQLYPDAQRTTVTGNVIDGNGQGVIFSGEGTSSNDNTVEGNVITNSQIRFNLESYYPDGTPLGQRNTATRNCVHNPKRTDAGPSGIDLREGGFTASANVTADPRFTDRDGDDFRLRSDSLCRVLMGARADTVPGMETYEAPQPQPQPSPQPQPQPQPQPPAPQPQPGPQPQPQPSPQPKTEAPKTAPAPKPARRLRLSLSAARAAGAIRSGRRLKLIGSVARGLRARRVAIQAFDGRRWRKVAVAKVTRRGTFSILWRVSAPRSGVLQLRATAPRAKSSAVLRLRVAR